MLDFLNVNPEDALERTNKKFIKRFQYLESKAELGKPLMDMTLAEMDVFWEEAKKSYNLLSQHIQYVRK
jgi:XTP/dITP diphosphohydrolase